MAEEYSIEELKTMPAEKANTVLSDSDFKRWQKIRDLEEEADENKKDLEKSYRKAFDSLVNKDEESVTREIEYLGNEIEYVFDMNREQENLIKQIENLESKENPTEQDESKYEYCLIDFFESIIVKWNGEKIREAEYTGKELAVYLLNRDDWGRGPLSELIQDIILNYFEEKRDKLEAVEKFR